jgi:hypothetical protein
MVRWLVCSSRVLDRGFVPRSGKTKDYIIGICCFCAEHAAFMSKDKDFRLRIRIICPNGGHFDLRTIVLES